MSKRNRNKFRGYNREQHHSANTLSAASMPARVSAESGPAAAHKGEYRIIRNDMIRLVVLNGIMLALVLVVYFTNRNAGYLEKLFEKIF